MVAYTRKRGAYNMVDEYYKKIFSKNLTYYMKLNHKTQTDLINDLFLNKSAVSTWCNGTRLPRMDKVDLLAKYFKINRSDLIEERNNTVHKHAVRINVLGRVAAGIPLEAIEEIIDTEEISEDMACTGEFFCLQIHGDSMEPRMYEGDVVIVRQQDDAESGDIVIAMINGNDATCKRLIKYAGGISLLSLNSKYNPMTFSNQEIQEKPVRIIGKVVELRGKF